MPAPDDAPKWTPGEWQYVASTEHHGPYVTSEFGNTICDCYTMTLPDQPSVRNGGPSKPVPFLAEMADPNARLIAAAPALAEAAQMLEDAEDAWANCPECDGEIMPELCPVCFPKFDDARLKRRAALALARGDSDA